MARFRSFLALVLVAVTVLLVSCGSPTKAVKPTYSPEQIAILQRDAADISTMRDRLTQLDELLPQGRPQAVTTLIRGPLGELRARMVAVTDNLLSEDQKDAQKISKTVINRLVGLDQAVQNGRFNDADGQYRALLRDLDSFLDLIPDEA